MIRLYGTILRDTGRDILIDVLPNNGGAPDVGLAGQVWFGKRQIILRPQTSDGFDVIECSYALASLKAQQKKQAPPVPPPAAPLLPPDDPSPPPKPKRKRRPRGDKPL